MADNIEALRRAYSAWDQSKGKNVGVWVDLAGDDFVFRSVDPEAEGLQYAGVHKGPELLAKAFAAILNDWEMHFYRANDLFGDADRIAMFGVCSWKSKATGRSVTTPIACLWRFRNGKAYECIEIFDSAAAAAAATP